MKAAYVKQPGPAENILYADLPLPDLRADEVLARVQAVTVNHVDTYIQGGKLSGKIVLTPDG